MLLCHVYFRHGGGTGSGDIRKIAYFEQSIDPQFLKVSVNILIVFIVLHNKSLLIT